MTPERDTCRHGHDLSIIGRRPDGSCPECKRASNRRPRRGAAPSPSQIKWRNDHARKHS